MLKAPHLVAALENEAQASIDRGRTYRDALAVYAALWEHARRLNPDVGSDWLSDVQADIAIARALRGLPPAP
jgi:hypothetical protein